MKYEERRSQEYVDYIMEGLIKDDRWIKDEYICFAMHKFFADGKYSLKDAMRMKLEDFHIYTKIHI